MGQISLFVAKR